MVHRSTCCGQNKGEVVSYKLTDALETQKGKTIVTIIDNTVMNNVGGVGDAGPMSTLVVDDYDAAHRGIRLLLADHKDIHKIFDSGLDAKSGGGAIVIVDARLNPSWKLGLQLGNVIRNVIGHTASAAVPPTQGVVTPCHDNHRYQAWQADV